MDAEFASHPTGRGSGTVVATGEIDVGSVPGLRAAFAELLEHDCPDITVDLSGVTLIDSTGLGVLVAGLKRARQAGGDIRLAGVREPVLKVLQITGLDEVFDVRPLGTSRPPMAS